MKKLIITSIGIIMVAGVTSFSLLNQPQQEVTTQNTPLAYIEAITSADTPQIRETTETVTAPPLVVESPDVPPNELQEPAVEKIYTPQEQRELFKVKHPDINIGYFDSIGVFKIKNLTEEAFDYYVGKYVIPIAKLRQ